MFLENFAKGLGWAWLETFSPLISKVVRSHSRVKQRMRWEMRNTKQDLKIQMIFINLVNSLT